MRRPRRGGAAHGLDGNCNGVRAPMTSTASRPGRRKRRYLLPPSLRPCRDGVARARLADGAATFPAQGERPCMRAARPGRDIRPIVLAARRRMISSVFGGIGHHRVIADFAYQHAARRAQGRRSVPGCRTGDVDEDIALDLKKPRTRDYWVEDRPVIHRPSSPKGSPGMPLNGGRAGHEIAPVPYAPEDDCSTVRAGCLRIFAESSFQPSRKPASRRQKA